LLKQLKPSASDRISTRKAIVDYLKVFIEGMKT
jgi:hypothetical protein